MMGTGQHTSTPSWAAGAGGLPLEEDEGEGGALAGAGCCMGGGGGAYCCGANCWPPCWGGACCTECQTLLSKQFIQLKPHGPS